MEITIERELFQWEKNRKVFVTQLSHEQIVTCVQFYNKNSCSGPEVPLINGVAVIPNYLLREPYPIVAVACIGFEGNTQAIGRREFKVLKRPRPENYYHNEEGIQKSIIYDGGEEI